MTGTPEARVRGAVLDRMIVAAMATGQTYAEIGRQLGYERSSIRRRAKQIESKAQAQGGHSRLTPADLEAIRQRLLAGDTITDIARRLKRARPTIAAAIRRHGLHMADLGQGQLDQMFARGLRTAVIALRTGLGDEVVSERRAEWKRRKRKEAALVATRAAAKAVRVVEPGCPLIAALRRVYSAPLTSLPASEATVGVPFRFGGVWRLGL